MQAFRILEHTADVGFEAFGSTPAEVFANAARALMNLIVDLDTIHPSRRSASANKRAGPRKRFGELVERNFVSA